jgi:hypothetical protein
VGNSNSLPPSFCSFSHSFSGVSVVIDYEAFDNSGVSQRWGWLAERGGFELSMPDLEKLYLAAERPLRLTGIGQTRWPNLASTIFDG